MRKYMIKPIFFCLAIVVIALFSVGSAMAFCDNCEPVDGDTISGWTVQLVSIDPIEGRDGWYNWHYQIYENASGTSSGLNYAAMLIPDCCTDPLIEIDINASTLFKDAFPVGEGEPTDDFGRFIQQAYVVKGTPDNDINWILVADTDIKTSTTFLLDVKKIKELPFEIAGPGCVPPLPDIVADSAKVEETVTTKGGYEFVLDCDKKSGCCVVTDFKNPDGTSRIINMVSIDVFLKNNPKSSKILNLSVPGVPCPGIVTEDSSENSPSYCSGGWCWY